MKRISLLILLLFATATCFGQKRVYLNYDRVYSENVFVIEEDGQPIVYYQIVNFEQPKDTLYFVLDKNDCEALREYLRDIKDVYARWTSAAKSKKVGELTRDVELEAPSLRMMWVSRYVPAWDFRAVSTGPNYARRTSEFHPVFRSYKSGTTNINLFTTLKADEQNGYNVEILLQNMHVIDKHIKRLNWKKFMRQYEKEEKKQYSEEELSEIFK